jgi:crotonobetainyl-CoA:carnitine CoA-transferase CaiB-like acyl-CoA transferase
VNPYRAGDGKWFWLIGLESARHWPGIARALGRPEWIDEEPFASGKGRRKECHHVITSMDAVLAEHPRSHWLERFDAEGVWWAPVHDPVDVLTDPQAIAAGAFVDVPVGDGAPAHRAVASPVDFGGVPTTPAGPVPGIGEHTEEVLRELELP